MKSFLLLPLAMAAFLGAATAADTPQGYLRPDQAVELWRVIPPAPTPGDIRDKADYGVYKAMKRQIGGERWRYATADIKYDTPTMLHDFECAAGVVLTPEALPATYRLLSAASADTGRANNAAKEHWQRPRPFWRDNGKVCEGLDTLGKSLDYPSGHTTKGWTLGLILAELLPDHAGAILARARSYGESRIVCRVHSMSAVDAGRTGATVTMESVRATPAYQADLAAAKAELAAARGLPAPDAGRCAADATVLDPSVLTALTK